MSPEILAVLLFIVSFAIIFRGYYVAFALGGCALLFFFVGMAFGYCDFALLKILPDRIFGIMSNSLLLAIPYFIFMGNVLGKSNFARDILVNIGNAFRKTRGGLGVTVILVGAILAASTSIVACSVVTIGLITLPIMLQRGYNKHYATGVVVASGTLGQIIPPSIVLIFLADQMGISVGSLFRGALIPGGILVGLYIIYTFILGKVVPQDLPSVQDDDSISRKQLWLAVFKSSLPPLLLIFTVLGSIFSGIATVSEAGSIGVIVTVLFAIYKKRIDWRGIFESAQETTITVSKILFLLIGSTLFSLVFRAFDGDILLEDFLVNLPGGKVGLILFSGIFIFLLGFFIDFFEIIFIIVPLLIPAAKALGIDLVWFAIIISMNLQTSFLTPPFGFSIFFLERSLSSKHQNTRYL